MAIKEIVSSGYSVYVGNLSQGNLNQKLKSDRYESVSKFILVDENTLEKCLPKLMVAIPALSNAEIIEIESGEINKNIDVCSQIWRVLSELQADRKSLLINLGGGVIGDMGGFAASTYKRGIDFINVPTTLLSQVDASVGGKLGIDLDSLKNQVGLINNPEGVYVDPDFLSTLESDQLRSGYAEIIKHALINSGDYWEKVKTTSPNTINDYSDLIDTSVNIKNEVVKEDPREFGLRKILNFGHTVGHAIEGYEMEKGIAPLLHGEAIAVGMICEAYMSVKRNILSEKDLEEINTYILSIYPPYEMKQQTYPQLMTYMRNDKKNSDGKINFTLIEGIGKAIWDQDCSEEEIIDGLNYYKSLVK